MKVSQGFARVRDGTPIGYSVHGDAAASRAAVLVHSLAMDRHFWGPVADRLASQGAVLVYDCRGHGASGAGGKSYSVAQFADDLADLMSELRWERRSSPARRWEAAWRSLLRSAIRSAP